MENSRTSFICFISAAITGVVGFDYPQLAIVFAGTVLLVLGVVTFDNR